MATGEAQEVSEEAERVVEEIFRIVVKEGRYTIIDRLIKAEDPGEIRECFYEALRLARSVEERIRIPDEGLAILDRPWLLKRAAVRAFASTIVE